MSLRTAIPLLLVVATGLAYAAAAAGEPPAPAATTAPAATLAAPTEAERVGATPAVTLYYFHATARCATCRAIEAHAEEALRAAFGRELANHTLAWRPLNVEEADNRHFISEFQLTSSSMVAVRHDPDGSRQWRRLDRIWPLAHDKAAFVRYVEEEVAATLRGAGR